MVLFRLIFSPLSLFPRRPWSKNSPWMNLLLLHCPSTLYSKSHRLGQQTYLLNSCRHWNCHPKRRKPMLQEECLWPHPSWTSSPYRPPYPSTSRPYPSSWWLSSPPYRPFSSPQSSSPAWCISYRNSSYTWWWQPSLSLPNILLRCRCWHTQSSYHPPTQSTLTPPTNTSYSYHPPPPPLNTSPPLPYPVITIAKEEQYECISRSARKKFLQRSVATRNGMTHAWCLP